MAITIYNPATTTTYTPERQPAEIKWNDPPVLHVRGDRRPKFGTLRTVELVFIADSMTRAEYNEWLLHADGEYRDVTMPAPGDADGETTVFGDVTLEVSGALFKLKRVFGVVVKVNGVYLP